MRALVEGVDVDGTTAEQAAAQVLRGHLEVASPLTAGELVRRTGLPPGRVAVGLAILEAEGFAIQGRFSERAVDADGRPGDGRVVEPSPARPHARVLAHPATPARRAGQRRAAHALPGAVAARHRAPPSTAASTAWPG